MAFVVARPRGRFEIREAVHTPDGPRARSLANFAVLTEEFLARAAARATRRFDPAAVITSARRVGAPVEMRRAARDAPASSDAGGRPAVASVPDDDVDPRYRRFAAASRRLGKLFERPPRSQRPDPGRALMELLAFADQVSASLPPRPPEPLTFPSLKRLVERRSGSRSGRRAAAASVPRRTATTGTRRAAVMPTSRRRTARAT